MIKPALLAISLTALAAAPGRRRSCQPAGRVQQLVGLFDRHRLRHDLLCPVARPAPASRATPSARRSFPGHATGPAAGQGRNRRSSTGYAAKEGAPAGLGIGGDKFNFFSRNDGPDGTRLAAGAERQQVADTTRSTMASRRWPAAPQRPRHQDRRYLCAGRLDDALAKIHSACNM